MLTALTNTAGVLAAGAAAAPVDGQGLTTSAVSGVIISHVLQPYMDKVPTILKPIIPVVASIVGSVSVCMGQGMGFKEALHYAVVTAASALINHSLAFAKPAQAV